ncbi:hypothetical protein RHGRI_006262 [Rhododendron griersonianum]|uniref:KANL3/Tex30 alpha/beta hydrolase-like domain-containing protein n=1 Tax=Rhododendron griersonianum TaxID=479676 RepID=A0AAV6KSW2_9ERIC|nr:hypothetical protein RHGRI_006262 [Rhododendron griersonianum]
MRGVGKSSGRPSLTGSSEVRDVVSVCKWVAQNFSVRRILLVGSSEGAPIAGSAVDQLDEVVGYVSLGYPFGLTASILFGGHHKAILQSPKPKLFVMGTRDGFTSVKQLQNKLKSAAGPILSKENVISFNRVCKSTKKETPKHNSRTTAYEGMLNRFIAMTVLPSGA